MNKLLLLIFSYLITNPLWACMLYSPWESMVSGTLPLIIYAFVFCISFFTLLIEESTNSFSARVIMAFLSLSGLAFTITITHSIYG